MRIVSFTIAMPGETFVPIEEEPRPINDSGNDWQSLCEEDNYAWRPLPSEDFLIPTASERQTYHSRQVYSPKRKFQRPPVAPSVETKETSDGRTAVAEKITKKHNGTEVCTDCHARRLLEEGNVEEFAEHDKKMRETMHKLYDRRVADVENSMNCLRSLAKQQQDQLKYCENVEESIRQNTAVASSELQAHHAGLQHQLNRLFQEATDELMESEAKRLRPFTAYKQHVQANINDLTSTIEMLSLKLEVETKTQFIQNYRYLSEEVERAMNIKTTPLHSFEEVSSSQFKFSRVCLTSEEEMAELQADSIKAREAAERKKAKQHRKAVEERDRLIAELTASYSELEELMRALQRGTATPQQKGASGKASLSKHSKASVKLENSDRVVSQLVPEPEVTLLGKKLITKHTAPSATDILKAPLGGPFSALLRKLDESHSDVESTAPSDTVNRLWSALKRRGVAESSDATSSTS